MASPESIKAGAPVAPAAPDEAKEADTAEAGKVEEAKASQHEVQNPDGTMTTITAEEKKDEGKRDPEKKGWIEIVLLNAKGKGIPGETWEIKAPDGQVFSGTTDDQGLARLDGIEEGQCEVTFPRLDKEAWEPA